MGKSVSDRMSSRLPLPAITVSPLWSPMPSNTKTVASLKGEGKKAEAAWLRSCPQKCKRSDGIPRAATSAATAVLKFGAMSMTGGSATMTRSRLWGEQLAWARQKARAWWGNAQSWRLRVKRSSWTAAKMVPFCRKTAALSWWKVERPRTLKSFQVLKFYWDSGISPHPLRPAGRASGISRHSAGKRRWRGTGGTDRRRYADP